MKIQREILDITQQKLAERAKLDLRFLQKLERGRVNFSIDLLAALADALKIMDVKKLLRPAKMPAARPGRPRKRDFELRV